MRTSTPSTDERLRNWLDGNQPARERLCQATLSMDRRFSNVTMRSPRGGPDGGRDLEAKFENNLRAWAAVGFQNSVSDSASEKTQAKKKFKSDLQRTLKEPDKPEVFVFFTNVVLSPGEKKALLRFAKDNGFAMSEIFDREQIRISLDSPEGLAIRYQYLQIELSAAEQQAFFARWGEDLQDLIVNSQTAIENRLRRSEFQVDRSLPLRSMPFHLFLKESLATSGLDHFRVLWRLILLPWRNRPKGTLRFNILACDSNRSLKAEVIKTSNTFSFSSWTAEKSFDHQGSSILDRDAKQIGIWLGGTSIMHRGLIDAALGDLDGAAFVINVNRGLAPLINGIMITANTYCVAAIPADRLRIGEADVKEALPFRLTSEELLEPWVRVGTESAPDYFNFSCHTPERLLSPAIIDPSAIIIA